VVVQLRVKSSASLFVARCALSRVDFAEIHVPKGILGSKGDKYKNHVPTIENDWIYQPRESQL
jgi:hypothetical protein